MNTPTNSLWLIHCVKIFLRCSVFSFYATLWLFAFYFSIYEDELAAILSYVAVALTVLAIKYPFHGMTSRSFIYSLSFLSKMLIFAGIFLAIFLQFWDTAFYSICLGIVIQKMKYEMELRADSVNSYLNVQIRGDDTKIDLSDEFKPLIHRKKSIQLHEVAQNETLIKEHEVQDLNEDEYCTFETQEDKVKLVRVLNKLLNKIKGLEIVQNETLSSQEDLTKLSLDFNEIVNGLGKVPLSPITNLKRDLEHSNKNESILHEENIKKKTYSLVDQAESVLRQSEKLLESKSESNYMGIEGKRLELLKIQKFGVTESSKIELDTANIKLKLKQNEDTPEKSAVLSEETLREDNLFANDIKQLDTIGKRIELLNGPENMKNGLFHAQVNVDSHIYQNHSRDVIQKSKFASFFEYENSLCQQDQSEMKDYLKTVNTSKDNVHLLLVDSECIDSDKISLQNGTSSDETNATNSVTDLEKSVINKTVLEKENSYLDNENSYSKTKFATENCPSKEIADIETEKETYAHQMKCKHVNDVNMKAISNKIALKVLPESESRLELKGLFNSCMTLDIEDYSSKRNESGSNAEERDEMNDLVTKASSDLAATYSSGVSNTEGVVNSIDLGFIYALGFNVPSMTDSF